MPKKFDFYELKEKFEKKAPQRNYAVLECPKNCPQRGGDCTEDNCIEIARLMEKDSIVEEFVQEKMLTPEERELAEERRKRRLTVGMQRRTYQLYSGASFKDSELWSLNRRVNHVCIVRGFRGQKRVERVVHGKKWLRRKGIGVNSKKELIQVTYEGGKKTVVCKVELLAASRAEAVEKAFEFFKRRVLESALELRDLPFDRYATTTARIRLRKRRGLYFG